MFDTLASGANQEPMGVDATLSRQHLSLLMPVKTYGVLFIDTNGVIRLWNQGAKHLVGNSASEACGTHYSQHFTHLADPHFNLWQALQTETPDQEFIVETSCRHKDGRELYFENSFSPIRNGNGKLTGFLVIARKIGAPENDFIGKKHPEFLEPTFEQAAVGLVVVNMADARFMKANKKICDLLGYTEEEFCTKSIPEVTHPDDVQGDLDNTRRMIMGEIEKFTMEKRLLRKDGTAVWTQLRPASIARDSNGIALYGMAVIEDISEWKRTEEALRESEDRFKLLADSAPVLIFVTDTEPRNVYVNKGWLDFTGVDHATALGPNWYQVIHPDDQEPYLEAFIGAFREQGDIQHELRVRQADGNYGWLLVTAVPRYSGHGLFLGYIGSGIDITHRKKMEEELLIHQRKLEQSNNDLEHFASIASHDLQMPLRKIALFSQYLAELEAEKLTDEGRDYLDRIQKSSHRMQRFVTDLLQLSKVTRQGAPFRKVALGKVVETAIVESSLTIKQAGGTVRCEALPEIEADDKQLEQLFINLIENSMKFRRTDTNPVVQVSADVTDTDCILTVADNGIGFPQEKSDRIFGIFERLHSSAQYGGTGIGLSIVKRIVERHFGEIFVTSEPGKGTTFSIRLPLRQESL